MFMGEALCLLIFYARSCCFRRYQEEEKYAMDEGEAMGLRTKVSWCWLLIPAACDTFSSALQFFGLLLIKSSLYQMLRGGVIIVTALLSVVLLNRKLYRHHYVGIVLCVIGIGIVGVCTLIFQVTCSHRNTSV
jgi:drug/metabolite transporter (DMT)-like permease